MTTPAYFESVRQRAATRWDQLESDAELAAPWHQLFRQVQSPRHVVSELLQNADDAGATEASVRIEGGFFIFDHNGEDFSEAHFASLCRFGYSNKRALHTIGFRGIGFKSTFSLGERVELFSPTLKICFLRERFTQPHWLANERVTPSRTRIRVKIADHHRSRELEKNLGEWLKSPVSLLFFRNIRRMRVGEQEVHWGSMGPGPVEGSEWMAHHSDPDDLHLVVRSAAEPFPEEALAEIRQERMLGRDEENEFPPCRMEIVLGATGRLYVVLPTGVETQLPFACNAPFIQDPARLKIKDPEISPTNRWLLERAGKLAAQCMLSWLDQSAVSNEERARAYGLFPNIDRSEQSLEGLCATIVEEAFDEALGETPFLLTDNGQLVGVKECIAVPDEVLDIWPSEQAVALLDDDGRPPLSPRVSADDRSKLLAWGVVEEVSKEDLLRILQNKHLPKPPTWRQLLALWSYVAPEITGFRYYVDPRKVRIVPVQGQDVLYAASEVARLGEKRLLQSDEDWEFLSGFLLALNVNWPRFLTESRRAAARAEDVEAAYAVLARIGLDATSDANSVIARIAAAFFGQDKVTIEASVRLAQIAAKLGAAVDSSFRFVTADRTLRSPSGSIVIDIDGRVEELIPPAQRPATLLHPQYTASFKSCTKDEWWKWIASGNAALRTFLPLLQQRRLLYGNSQVASEAAKRGVKGELLHHYKTSNYALDDWDFDALVWPHWEKMARADPRVWAKIAEFILDQDVRLWSQASHARLLQFSTNRAERSITSEPALASWVLRLRDLPCLPDTNGFPRKPADLLRRTRETEALLDVEQFVDRRYDREAKASLLDLLGVRCTPTGPDRILECLRALAQSTAPPVHEVEKWYRRLDQLLHSCSTAQFQKVAASFQLQRIILAHDGTWQTAAGVFLASDESDVPDAATIRPSVADLTLWRKVGVADRPTIELALAWLKGLPSGKALNPDEQRRVRSLLARYPQRIWLECGHWLNLAGEWVATNGLAYALTMQSLVRYSHLHPWVREKTADLQKLSAEIASGSPFSSLPTLASVIDERLHRAKDVPAGATTRAWLAALGAELRRVVLDDQEEIQRVRALATRIVATLWVETPGLEITPYIDGTPAGTPSTADVLWLENVLYVDRLPKAKLAKRVPEEIGRAFARQDLRAALDYSFDRSAADVREYITQNFTLAAVDTIETPPAREKELDTIDDTAAASADCDAEEIPADTEPSENALIDEESKTDAEDEGDFEAGEGTEPEPAAEHARKPRPAAPPKPLLIERFATANGFRKDGDNRYFHRDGSWIARQGDGPFRWERRKSSGELVCSYLDKDHCLATEPLQLDAEVWGLLDRFPATHSLLLADPAGQPVEYSGSSLKALTEAKRIILYPATYRLVWTDDD